MQEQVRKRLRLINTLGAAGVALILAGAGAFGVMPLWRSGVQDIRDSAKLKQNLRELDNVTLKVARVQEERKAREARLHEAESRLPTLAGVNQFVPELAKVAEASGLQVDHVAPARELSDAGDYKLMSVEVAGKGDWQTCYNFLTGLRGPDHKLTRLDGLRLEVDREKSADRPICRLSVNISTLLAR